MVLLALSAGSVGDIQGVIGLLCRLGLVLYDANDASRDYEELKQEIHAFYGTLLEVQKVQDSMSSECSVDALGSEIAQCHADLHNFFHKYHMQNRWNKIKWTVWGNSAAMSLREMLMRHRQTIQTRLTTTIFLYDRSQWHDRDRTIKDIHSIVQQGVETICLVDVYGNRNEISMEHCQSFEMFNDFVKYYFRHQRPPGNVYVERDAYQLLKADGAMVSDKSKWSISRGETIEMSAIVQWKAPITQKNPRCPGCGSQEKSPSKGEWFECKRCSVLYQVKESEADSMEIVTPGCQIGPIKQEPPKQLEKLGTSDRKEIGKLRRILILPEEDLAYRDTNNADTWVWYDMWFEFWDADWRWDRRFPIKRQVSRQ